SHSLKRKGRGPTRGKGTDDIISADEKISLEISKTWEELLEINKQVWLVSVALSFDPLLHSVTI
ncbi:Hypothetical predicted protein, partial [Olea europaea subsp. europaea]